MSLGQPMERGEINGPAAGPTGRQSMKAGPRRPTLFTILILVGLLGVNIYRAATMSLCHDEARTWRDYMLGPLDASFTYFWTNHHVLHSLLAKLVTWVFGFSELSIRGVSLAGGALYFAGVFALCRRLLGRGWRASAVTLLACLNPFLLDFLVVARGYGLGLALLVWATYCMVVALDCADPPGEPNPGAPAGQSGCGNTSGDVKASSPLEGEGGRYSGRVRGKLRIPQTCPPSLNSLVRSSPITCHTCQPARAHADNWWGAASALLGLSVAANLIYVFPATALALVFAGALLADAAAELPLRQWFALLRRLVICFVLPGPLLAAAICAPALRHATLASFDMGIPHLRDSVADLLAASLHHHEIVESAAAQALAGAIGAAVAWVALPVLALLMVIAVTVLTRAWWRSRRITALRTEDRWTLLLGLTALLTVAIYLTAHVLLGVRFPDARSALFVIMFMTLEAALLLGWLERRCVGTGPARSGVRAAGTVLAAGVLLLYLLQFHIAYTREWRYDAADKTIFAEMVSRSEMVAANVAQPAPGSIPGNNRNTRGLLFTGILRIGGSLLLGPSMNYYYDRYKPARLSRFLPVVNDAGSYDFLALTDDEGKELILTHPGMFQIILHDPTAGTWLLQRSR